MSCQRVGAFGLGRAHSSRPGLWWSVSAAIRPRRYELSDYRDLQTGTLAMARAVGVPASVVAQMVLSRALRHPGVAAPIRDIPAEPFFDALAERGIRMVEREIEPAQCSMTQAV